MKMKASTGRKLRYGGVSAALTVLIVAAIILVNVIFSALSQKFTLYTDLTPEALFTLSDECIDLLRNGDDTFEQSFSPIEMIDKMREENRLYNEANGLTKGSDGYRDEHVMIHLIYCDEPDAWTADLAMHYVYNTGLELQAEFPDYIEVKNYNIVRNPSLVTKYKTNSMTTIAQDSVIVSLDSGANDGLRYRIRGLQSFYVMTTETTNPEPWAYNGDKAFAASILSVTNAESPLACYTSNHRETASAELTQTLIDAGYTVGTVDLKNEEIPANCRLLVIFDPQDDFLVKDGTGLSDVDEIAKIERHLDENMASLMVFFSPSTPVLPKLEEYLAEWGIEYDRYTDTQSNTHPYIIKDDAHSLTTDGNTVVAEYVTNNPMSSITSDMRSRAYPQSVIFKNAMSISYSDIYSPQRYVDEKDKTNTYDYAAYSKDGTNRMIYNLFTTSADAVAMANGQVVEKATENERLALMTVSVENHHTQESNYSSMTETSYVIAFGSTEFAADNLLQSTAIGNTDLLLSTLRTVGQEPVPVGIGFKPFADDTIDTITTSETTQYTVVLTVVPIVIALAAGIFVIVRRKNR